MDCVIYYYLQDFIFFFVKTWLTSPFSDNFLFLASIIMYSNMTDTAVAAGIRVFVKC